MTGPFRSRTFHALAHDFRIVADDATVGRHLTALFDAFAPGDEAHSVTYEIAPGVDDGLRFAVRVDDAVVVNARTTAELVDGVVHRLNLAAVDGDYAVMAHAGAVERGGAGLVFPAHMESGKTTLTAGLVRAGFGYLTDEAVAFDWDTGVIEPYPKPLSIDPGSFPLFAELAPPPAPGDDTAPEAQWQVPVRAFGPDARVGRPCRCAGLVFPAYGDGVRTQLVPMTRADALVELAKNTFEFRDRPRRALVALSRVVTDAACFRMPVGDLDTACALVADLVERLGVDVRRG